mmetsp:Transcript_102191/g.218819  ORF Transcript_102191/g.218819 Transcript_102191/m.218819 type:complete len:258 (+) Transcript_102191:77-850(+)
MLGCSKFCVPSDRTRDTVRVDVNELLEESQTKIERFENDEGKFVEVHGDGERLVVGANSEAEAKALVKSWQEAMKRQTLEKEAAARAEEERVRAKQQAEEMRRQEEAEHLARAKEMQRQEEEARQRRETQERKRLEEELARREQAEKEEEVRRLAEEAKERQEILTAFLKENGFPFGAPLNVNASKRTMMKTTYPLHYAAEAGRSDIVEMLLTEGAEPSHKNSAGRTAADLAQKKDKRGSHAEVLRLLGNTCTYDVA